MCLSNNTKEHANARISATQIAFFALKSAGVFSKGVKTEAMAYLYKTTIRPVLLYGLQSVGNTKKSRKEIEKLQGKLLKAILNLKLSCRNTPLLHAMKIPRIEESVRQQEVMLLRALLTSTS